MALLVKTQGSHSNKWIFQIKDRLLLGRHPECDTAGLFAGINGVSRHHAVIERHGDQYLVQDNGSRNGTMVNGEPLKGSRPLRDADRIDICGIELQFCADPEDASQPSGETEVVHLVDDQGPAPELVTVCAVAPPAPVSQAGYSIEKFQALTRMLKQLGSSIDIDETLRELLSGLFAIFPQADRGFVGFLEGQDQITVRASRLRQGLMKSAAGLSRTLVNQIRTRREAVLWTDHVGHDSLQSASMMELEIRSAMCAPLLDVEGQPFGLVQITSSQSLNAFVSEDLEVMSGAVSQAAVAVRFAQLHEAALQRQALERDLQLARQVQYSLLPAECPSWSNYEFFAHYQSAHEVGGDYYDFIDLPNERLAIVVADVAGKGVSAALLVARLSGELKYYLSCAPATVAVARMNDSLCNSSSGRFVTLLLAILERGTHRLTLINAGHPTPLLRHGAGPVEGIGAEQRGIALGILPGSEYNEFRTDVNPGDVWFAFTDGFTEAISPQGELYGSRRVQEQLAPNPAGVRHAGERLVADVYRFLGNHPQSDDMCLVGFGRLEASPIEKSSTQAQGTQPLPATLVRRRNG